MKKWTFIALALPVVIVASAFVIKAIQARSFNKSEILWQRVVLPETASANAGVNNFVSDVTLAGENQLLIDYFFAGAKLIAFDGNILAELPAGNSPRASLYAQTAVLPGNQIAAGLSDGSIAVYGTGVGEIWKHDLQIENPISINLVADQHGQLYVTALHSMSGSFDRDGNLLWKLDADTLGSGLLPPVLSVDESVVYFQGKNGEVVAVAQDGTEIWRSPPESLSVHPPIPTGTGDLICPLFDRLRVLNEEGQVALEIETDIDLVSCNAAMDSEGSIYFFTNLSATKTALVAFDKTGKKKWQYSDAETISQVSVMNDGNLLLYHSDRAFDPVGFLEKADEVLNPTACRLVVISPEGKVLRKTDLPFELAAGNPILMDDGTVLILDHFGKLYCIQP